MAKQPRTSPALPVSDQVTIVPVSCPHYKRKCEFYTPCCEKTYRCRFCHDQSEDHVLQREDVLEVVCSACGHRQPVANDCNNCKTTFGKYFCYECKLFDDDDKEQFHCDGCGICRIGGRENFFHCPTCNMCLPTHLEGNHRCIENLSRANCPICQEDIHTSREPSQIPPCNHLIHKSCFDQLVRSGHFYCPVCAHSLVDMTEMWHLYDQHIRETPLPSLYQDLYTQTFCRDCLATTSSRFHILGIKCSSCSGYNTVRTKGPLMRKQEDGTFKEADLTSDDVVVPSRTSTGSSPTPSTSASSSPSSSASASPPASPSATASPNQSIDSGVDVSTDEVSSTTSELSDGSARTSLLGGLIRGARGRRTNHNGSVTAMPSLDDLNMAATTTVRVHESSVEDWDSGTASVRASASRSEAMEDK